MMRFFLVVSLLLVLYSCSQPRYRGLTAVHSALPQAEVLRPDFERQLYRCVVNGKFLLKKFHLSGILYLKNFSDTATRVVFQGEMGNTFFDFGWDHKDSFIVYNILPQMNKSALIRTLRKDFELLLLKNIAMEKQELYKNGQDDIFLKFRLGADSGLSRGYVYYVLNQQGNRLKRIENADNKRRVVVMEMTPPAVLSALPDAVFIRHLRAHFTIDLKKIQADAE